MNEPPVPTYWTDDRKELRAWFARNAPSLGELYEGALRILFSETPFPGRVRFVAHAVREIRNRLPDVIAGPKQSQRVEYVNRMDQLCEKWEKSNLPTDGSLPISLSKENEVPNTTGVAIPTDVYEEIARLIRDHKASRETPRDAAKRLYEAIDPNNRMAEAILRPRINHWIEVTEWFVKLVHDNGSTDDRIDLEELKNRFGVFEKALLAMVRGFFETVGELDDILEEANWKKPTPEQVDKAVSLLVYLEHYRYFFDRLENPEWLEPLRKKGFFKQPPEPERNEEEGTIRFPPWPQSRYLARMARHKPELVAKIIEEMDDTDNVAVVPDLVEALLAMPPDVSARLVQKVVRWAASPYLMFPEELGQLISHLANGGKTEEAMAIARALLDIPLEPRVWFDTGHYEQILKNHYPDLVRKAGLPALELLCELLDRAIGLPLRGDGDQGPEDGSYIWRPAIEDHPQNHGFGQSIEFGGEITIADALVTGIRDAAELVVRSGLATIEETVKLLESKRWKVFRRIALHLIRVFAEQEPRLAAERLTDRTLFDDEGLWHEYVMLLRECFPRLTPEEQTQILGWIENGPDVDEWKQWHESVTGRQPTEEEVTKYREIWQRDWLARIGPDNLPAEWRERYEHLCAKYGKPDHPEFSFYVSELRSPASPKTADELKGMSVEEIVEFLKSWKPPGNVFGEPSPEGLGRVLSSVVAEDPGRFAAEAWKFKGLDPTYVWGVLSGLKDALVKQGKFDWEPVLDLCEWVLSQPREIPGRRGRMRNADPDWRWTRKTIADLLSAGLEDRPGGIPIGLRQRVWAILKPLTEDPDPTPEREQRDGGFNLDPAKLSNNTTRGKAMHAVVRYALWVRRHLEKEPNAEQRLQKGFEEMPEVREVLEAHLDPAREPSLAVRAVYGRWFPSLVLLDPEWARTHAQAIFPLDQESKAFFEAAWNAYVVSCEAYDNAYVVFCEAYDKVLEILRPQYEHAVERIGLRRDDTRWLADPDEKLAEHLMEFYWRGKLPLDDPLLASFWKNAPDDLRAHALAFVGRALKGTEGDVPEEILDRLEHLWEVRLDTAKTAKKAQQPSDFEKEMAAFGWWFVSGKFDVEWAIGQLLEALRLARKAKPDHEVLEHLARVAQKHPRESVECLRILAEADPERLKLRAGRDHVRRILEAGLQHPSTADEAKRVINDLGSRGREFLEFGDLLKAKDKS